MNICHFVCVLKVASSYVNYVITQQFRNGFGWNAVCLEIISWVCWKIDRSLLGMYMCVKMPPIRKKDPLKSAQNERKIKLAILNLKNKRIHSIHEAARIYTVARTTLYDWMKGVLYRHIIRANSHKLTQSEEDFLVKWVLDLDRRGLPPRHSLVRDMANYFLL